MKNNKFDYIYPPDFEPHKHRLASRIFKGLNETSLEECQCCSRKVGKEEVQTSCSIEPTQLSFLGSGVPLFFHFLKSTIFLLLLMLLIFSGFCIYSNVTSSDCQTNSDCISDGFNTLSIVNKETNYTYLSIQSYLGVAFTLVSILFFHYIRAKARQLKQQCDEIVDSPSDYAIILKRLPEKTSENDILDMIQRKKKDVDAETLAKTENLQVVKIILAYSLREYLEVVSQNKEEFIRCAKEQTIASFKPKDLPQPTQTSHIAIVIFQHQDTKDIFIHEPTICQRILQFFCTPCLPLSELTIKGQPIAIERAPQPDEIYWQNSGITMSGSICRKVSFGIISLFILGVGGGAQYYLAVLASQATDDLMKLVFRFLNPLIVNIFNSIILVTLVIMTEKERNETVTEFQSVLVVKITFLQFFNAGIFVIASKIAATYQTFDIGNGIVSQISLIMIVDALVPNALNFFLKYFELPTKLKLFLVRRGWWVVSQKQLNKFAIGPEINMPKKYGYILKTLLLTALYSPMIPAVGVIALCSMTVNYFIEKILFTSTYSMPHALSSMTFDSSIELLEYFLITFSLGEFVIYGYFYSYKIEQLPLQWLIAIFVTMGLAILNSALPMEAINEKLFHVEPSSRSSLTYTQVEEQFDVTYQMLNPAYNTERKRRKKQPEGGETKKGAKEAVVDIIEMMNAATAENQLQSSRKPLLGDVVTNYGHQVQEIEMQPIKKDKGLEKDNEDSSSLNSESFQRKQLFFQDDQQSSPKGCSTLNRGERQIAYIPRRQKKENSWFKYVQVKQVKSKVQNPYRALVSKLLGKVQDKEEKEEEGGIANLESIMVGIPEKAEQNSQTKKENHQIVEQTFREHFGQPSTSKTSVLTQTRRPISSQELAFSDPNKQVKATYDPIAVGGSYKQFFGNPQNLLQKQGNYLNKALVMKYLGTPFASLVNTNEKETSQIISNPISHKESQEQS